MSYMRGEWYVYSDGEYLNIIHGETSVRMPTETAEELALMLALEMIEEGNIEATAKRIADKHHGNCGADAVAKLIGLPSMFEMVEGLVAAAKGEGEELSTEATV